MDFFKGSIDFVDHKKGFPKNIFQGPIVPSFFLIFIGPTDKGLKRIFMWFLLGKNCFKQQKQMSFLNIFHKK